MQARKGRKALKRLQARRKDFDKGSESKESKVQMRWETNGYHRPGSNQK
jgi:hypothetical protein